MILVSEVTMVMKLSTFVSSYDCQLHGDLRDWPGIGEQSKSSSSCYSRFLRIFAPINLNWCVFSRIWRGLDSRAATNELEVPILCPEILF